MHAEDLPILSYLVQVASGGEKKLDAVRLRAAVEPLLDGAGSVRGGQAREDFVRIVETMVDRREGWPHTHTDPRQNPPWAAPPCSAGGPMNINVTFKTDDPCLARIDQMLAQVLSTQEVLLQRSAEMSEALDRLTSEVAETRGVTDSVLALLGNVAQQIRDNVDNSAALAALADDLDANQQRLADAVANFPTGSGSTGGVDTGGGATEPAVEPSPITGDTGDATDANPDADATRFDDTTTDANL